MQRMLPSDTTLKQSPWPKNVEGNTRRVGVELEMGGLELDALAALVARFLDLEISSEGRYERKLLGDPAGDWAVEFDYNLLKKLGRKERGGAALTDQMGQSAEDLLAWAAETFVPLEIVSPPLPLDRLKEVEALIAHLREAGATGTSSSAVHAFGIQLNPELPSHEATTITASLKAFACLYEWLALRGVVDLSRRVTSYVDPFPTDYVKKLLAADYWPGLTTLIDDYLADNPTRNRALDMLPLFTFLDEERVRAITNDPLIKARPTFHYRLPDCRIDEPDWGLHGAWNDWVEVERLAADEARLRACCGAYLEFLDSPWKRLVSKWATSIDTKWLDR